MFYVYIIQSIKFKRFYIGSSENLKKRLYKHNTGGVRSTKAYKPWEIVHKEEYQDKTSARKRENQLKKNYQIRKQIIEKIK